MIKAIKLDPDDIKKILADHFHVNKEDVIKAQYSYFVTGVDLNRKDNEV